MPTTAQTDICPSTLGQKKIP